MNVEQSVFVGCSVHLLCVCTCVPVYTCMCASEYRDLWWDVVNDVVVTRGLEKIH